MKELISSLIDATIRSVAGEGQRLAQAKALGAGIRVIRGVRGLLLLNYVIQALVFVWVFGLLSSVYIALEQYSRLDVIELTLPFAFCLSVFALSSLILGFTVRERTWIRTFGLEELIEKTLELPEPDGSSDPDAERLSQLIQRAVNEAVERKLSASTAPSAKSQADPSR